MKEIVSVHGAPPGHWVGDGFPVRSLFTYDAMEAGQISPFLMLDYAGPHDFEPAARPRGVGAHPHRGFETVTIVYEGEVAHRDSSGGGGVIGRGDVQWMTAGDGIIHEEFHSPSFTATGGRFEVVQLWVNLAAAHKSTPPAYQSIRAADIPRLALPDAAGTVAVIAGSYEDAAGPARTFSPMNVWDLRLVQAGTTTLRVPEGHNTLLVVLSGAVRVNGARLMRDAELALLSREGRQIVLAADSDARVLLLSGAPIDEPVVGYGPFVMNSTEEIQESIQGFRSGRLGKL